MARSAVTVLREARLWMRELRHLAQSLRPAVSAAVVRGRAQAKANRPKASSVAEGTIAALRSMGFKARPAEIAVRGALADVGDEDPEALMRAALRRLG